MVQVRLHLDLHIAEHDGVPIGEILMEAVTAVLVPPPRPSLSATLHMALYPVCSGICLPAQ